MKVHRSGAWRQSQGSWVHHQGQWVALTFKRPAPTDGLAFCLSNSNGGAGTTRTFKFSRYLPGRYREYYHPTSTFGGNGYDENPWSLVVDGVSKGFWLSQMQVVTAPDGFTQWYVLQIGPFSWDTLF
jgi:hypothetical protein